MHTYIIIISTAWFDPGIPITPLPDVYLSMSLSVSVVLRNA
jgi:hypothetical protein